MSYASVDQLQAAIPARDLERLTDWDGGEGAAVVERLQAALDDASAEIDSHIARAVTLPLDPVPHILIVYCRDLALHRLYVNVGDDHAGSKSLRDEAIAYLKSVARGEAALGDMGLPPDTTEPAVAMTGGAERVMTRESLRRF